MKTVIFGATGMEGATENALLATPLYPLLRALAPNLITSTETLGRAMLRIAIRGAEKRLIEQADINALGA